MPRAIWKGAVSFGLVAIPVKLYTATEDKDISFHLLHKKDHARIKQQRYCPEDDAVVEWNDVVRGYEIAPDQYVVMEPEDFDKVPVDTTHTIEITDFVPDEQIDPIYYQKTYYLEPERTGGKPFALLREVLKDSKLIALAKVTLRQKEQLCTLRLYENTIALETMFYADEIRSAEGLDIPEMDKVSDRELKMAKSLVDMLTGDFEPEKYQDNYRDALLELIERKAEGEEIKRPAPVAGKVTDLMEALRKSIDSAKRDRGRAAEEPEEEEREAKPARRRRAG
ncbi:MAG TPA: Ku protein [Dehalococcoidia bacterium]|nr:Ku protein [Dehalococcoidia bacterium]